ncbi:MAG: S1 RNA-binding domain-containing protein, partial [Tannerellaceae bacterium]
LAQNIVDYRAENGAFKTRKELLKVARLGQKAFEQCAGFLRIQNGTNPLDASAVHPESYYIVEQMAKDLGCSVSQLMSDEALRKQIDPARYLSDTVGLPTIQDILKELDKPGRDPRDRKKAFSFSKEIRTMNDLQEGMVVNGIVNNITNFGCFVNIGIKENGLIHKSHMAKEFVNDPSQYVSLNQQVRAKVVSIDKDRKRIGLSLIDVE